MKIDTDALKKQVILHLPYLLFLLVLHWSTKIGHLNCIF